MQDGFPAARIEVKVEGDLDSQTSASDPRRMIEVLTNPLAEYIFGSLK